MAPRQNEDSGAVTARRQSGRGKSLRLSKVPSDSDESDDGMDMQHTVRGRLNLSPRKHEKKHAFEEEGPSESLLATFRSRKGRMLRDFRSSNPLSAPKRADELSHRGASGFVEEAVVKRMQDHDKEVQTLAKQLNEMRSLIQSKEQVIKELDSQLKDIRKAKKGKSDTNQLLKQKGTLEYELESTHEKMEDAAGNQKMYNHMINRIKNWMIKDQEKLTKIRASIAAAKRNIEKMNSQCTEMRNAAKYSEERLSNMRAEIKDQHDQERNEIKKTRRAIQKGAKLNQMMKEHAAEIESKREEDKRNSQKQHYYAHLVQDKIIQQKTERQDERSDQYDEQLSQLSAVFGSDNPEAVLAKYLNAKPAQDELEQQKRRAEDKIPWLQSEIERMIGQKSHLETVGSSVLDYNEISRVDDRLKQLDRDFIAKKQKYIRVFMCIQTAQTGITELNRRLGTPWADRFFIDVNPEAEPKYAEDTMKALQAVEEALRRMLDELHARDIDTNHNPDVEFQANGHTYNNIRVDATELFDPDRQDDDEDDSGDDEEDESDDSEDNVLDRDYINRMRGGMVPNRKKKKKKKKSKSRLNTAEDTSDDTMSQTYSSSNKKKQKPKRTVTIDAKTPVAPDQPSPRNRAPRRPTRYRSGDPEDAEDIAIRPVSREHQRLA